MALVFDEYDAGRPDVMFVIQRILEVDGKLTLLDQNKILEPNSSFRLSGDKENDIESIKRDLMESSKAYQNPT